MLVEILNDSNILANVVYFKKGHMLRESLNSKLPR